VKLHSIIKKVKVFATAAIFGSINITGFGQASNIVINPNGGTSSLLNDGLKILILTDGSVHVYRQNMSQYYQGVTYPSTSTASSVRFRCHFERSGVFSSAIVSFAACATTPATQSGNNWTESMTGTVASPLSGATFYITIDFFYTHPNNYFTVDYIVKAPTSLPGGAEIVHMYLDHDAYILGSDASRGMRTVNATGEFVGNYRLGTDNTTSCSPARTIGFDHYPSSHGFKADSRGFRSYYTGYYFDRMIGPIDVPLSPTRMLTNLVNTSNCPDDGVAVNFSTVALSANQTDARRVLHCYGSAQNDFVNTVVGNPPVVASSSSVVVNFTSATYNEIEGNAIHPATTIQITV
jgi:hypothetical protein